MSNKKWFFLVWGGQALSILGSSMTSFALGIWLYQCTGLASNFAFVALASVLPQMLLSPLAGVLTDRFNRRNLMAFSDAAAAVCTVLIASLFLSRAIEVWHIYLATVLSSACGAIQGPAYSALVAGSIEKQQLGRANGLLQFGQALCQILAPGFAGVLVGSIGVAGVLFVDLATFVVAVATLIWSKLPADLPVQTNVTPTTSVGFLRESLQGWQAIKTTPGMTGLLYFQSVFTFLWSIFAVMVTPMVLGFAQPDGLGLTLTIAGVGLLSGSLVMTAWGGPKKRLNGLLGFELVSALAFVLMGLRPNLITVGVGAFCAHFTLAFVSSLSDSIWQEKAPSESMGRVLALRQMFVKATTLLAYLMAGVLMDKLIDPLLQTGGLLAGSLGVFFGTGTGRGIALACSLIGLVKILSAGLLAFPVRKEWDQLEEIQV